MKLTVDLRDEFAKEAMRILLKNRTDHPDMPFATFQHLAVSSYQLADAMLKARAERNDNE